MSDFFSGLANAQQGLKFDPTQGEDGKKSILISSAASALALEVGFVQYVLVLQSLSTYWILYVTFMRV